MGGILCTTEPYGDVRCGRFRRRPWAFVIVGRVFARVRTIGGVALAIFDLDNAPIDRATAFRRWAVGFAAGCELGPDAVDRPAELVQQIEVDSGAVGGGHAWTAPSRVVRARPSGAVESARTGAVEARSSGAVGSARSSAVRAGARSAVGSARRGAVGARAGGSGGGAAAEACARDGVSTS
jgi:hypothetical protein